MLISTCSNIRCPAAAFPEHGISDDFKQPDNDGAFYDGAIMHVGELSVCVDGSTKFRVLAAEILGWKIVNLKITMRS